MQEKLIKVMHTGMFNHSALKARCTSICPHHMHWDNCTHTMQVPYLQLCFYLFQKHFICILYRSKDNIMPFFLSMKCGHRVLMRQ
jgi:hypothetical protein